nr:unnamed protein product [Callosobruchus analis]
MARISKLLILMEKGEAGQFKGQSLDQFNLKLKEELPDEDCKEGGETYPEINFDTDSNSDTEDQELKRSKCKALIQNKKRIVVQWTDQQKVVVSTYFKDHISRKVPPKKAECLDLISKNVNLSQNKVGAKLRRTFKMNIQASVNR